MQEQKSERGPRGRYARLICRGCRSRKIKCSLPNPVEIVPLGIPQPVQESCERCRHFGLECIVERTTLGRPGPRRNYYRKSHDPSPSSLAGLSSKNDDDESEGVSSCNLDIQDYLFAEVPDDSSILRRESNKTDSFRQPSNKEIFQSMIDPHFFFSSVLAKDRAFGASIPRATSRWIEPLANVVSDDMAASLDNRLVWHRFFLPQIPTLVSMRRNLHSDDSTNSATNLLFALLCLTGLETSADSFAQRQSSLKRNLQLAVAFYGQEFVMFPPTHQHSIVLCLFLSEYKPTALVTLQCFAHKAVRSQLHIDLAWRIAERLGILPGQVSLLSLEVLQAPGGVDFQRCLTESIQGMQIICHDILLGGHLSKPHHQLQYVIRCMKPHVDAYKKALSSGHCSPNDIFHIQWIRANYILLEAMADAGQNQDNPERLLMIVESVERECLDQIKSSHCLLVDASKYGQRDELCAARSLLELYFTMVFVKICGFGMVLTSVFSARLQSDKPGKDSETFSHGALHITTQVARSTNNTDDRTGSYFSKILARYGKIYPIQLGAILEMFVECTTLKLNGITLQPSFQLIVLGIVVNCRNIVENNIIRLKCFGTPSPDFEKQLEFFGECVRRLDVIAAPSCSQTDVAAAFANGCVYAAASKIIAGLLHIMETLQAEASKLKDAKSNNENSKDAVASCGGFNLTSSYLDDAWSSGLATSWETSNLKPFLGAFDPFDFSQNLFDWSFGTNLGVSAGLDVASMFGQNLGG